jgi:hypothetical protein
MLAGAALGLAAAAPLVLGTALKLYLRPVPAWRVASWRERPFFSDPPQAFHMIAWYFTAVGVASLLSALLQSDGSTRIAAVTGGLGLGLHAGLYAARRLFPVAFTSQQRGPDAKSGHTNRPTPPTAT